MKLIDSNLYQEELDNLIKTINISNFENKKILISGATGLIGSYLVDTFYKLNKTLKQTKKMSIYCIGRSRKKFSDRFEYLNSDSCIHFLEQDICKEIYIDSQIDYIFHGASNADPKSYASYPTDTILTNILGTKSILDFAKKNNKNCKIVLMSTMEVYGSEIKNEAFKENDYGKINFNQIRSGYPESKRVAELLIRCYNEEFGVKGIIARLGYIYGPSMQKNDSKAVAQFIRNAVSNENIVLKSRGLQKRSYCYISDVANALIQIIEKGEIGNIYNVADNNSIVTISELAKIAAKIADTEVIYEKPDLLEEKGFSIPQNNILEISKLNSLGWSANYDIEEGIRRTINILRGE